MAVLTREEILKGLYRTPVEYDVPEWGGSVMLRGLSLKEREEYTSRIQDGEGEIDAVKASVWAIIMGTVDPEFTVKDYDHLKGLTAGVMDRIAMRVMQLSGLNEEDQEKTRQDF